jgi:transcriptional regulator with XRE-family HTH domain
MMPYVSHIPRAMSIPYASQDEGIKPYPADMPKKSDWRHWGARFRNEAARKGVSTKVVAGRIDQAESTVRSWLNGNREANLTDFFRLCDAAGIEPALVLFAEVGKVIAAWNLAEGGERESLVLITEAILKRHEEAAGRRRGAA